MRDEFKERLIGMAALLIILLVLSGSSLLVLAAVNASANTLRWWALLVTVSLVTLTPLTGLVAWKLGRRDAQERLAGINTGVDQVMRAAHGTAALRVNVLRATQQVKDPTAPVITMLPTEPEFRDPPLLQAGQVVEL
ncbi:MAG: hypothetical protein KKA73_17340 [Chloroflexi bacterium]|nr:hypothetical protein [Chloroflexota bacterium]